MEFFGQFYEHVRTELQRLIDTTAERLGYDRTWANDEVRQFLALLNDPGDLFDQSKRQNVVLYRDANIVVYAVKWEWVLSRKMKRLQMVGQRPRREDWQDCISIAKLLYDTYGGTLSPRILTRAATY